MKTPVITSKDYIVYLEYSFNMTFIHCDCYRGTKEVKQTLKKDFETLLSIHRQPVFAIHEIDDTKHLKFITMMGFTLFTDFVGSDNKPRQLFVRNI